MNKKLNILFLLLITSFLFTGCYYRATIESNQLGLLKPDGLNVTQVVGPGRHPGDNGWYADYDVIDNSVITWIWEDKDLVTKDKQPIGLQLAISVKRNHEPSKLIMMYNVYKSEALDNEALKALVNNRIPRAAKAITAKYTLDQMLGIGTTVAISDTAGSGFGREVTQQDIFNLLSVELNEVGILVIDVGISNISTSESFSRLLEEKANQQQQAEIQAAEAKKLAEQLEKEKRQTDIAVEVAARDAKVQAELNKVFIDSPQALELKKIELLAAALNNKDKIFFVTPDTPLTLYLSGLSGEPATTILPPPPVESPAAP